MPVTTTRSLMFLSFILSPDWLTFYSLFEAIATRSLDTPSIRSAQTEPMRVNYTSSGPVPATPESRG